MELFESIKGISLETVTHSAKNLVAPGFSGSMGRYLVSPSIHSVLLDSQNKLVEHLVVLSFMHRPYCLRFYFSLLLLTKHFIFHCFAILLHLHYHFLLVTSFLLCGILLPVGEVREYIVIVHHNYARSYFCVHSYLKCSSMLFPVIKICEQPLSHHITDNRSRFPLTFSLHFIFMIFVELSMILKSYIHVVS